MYNVCIISLYGVIMISLEKFIKGNEVLFTETFQEAVDYASSKKEPLFIPCGEYVLGTVELKSNTTIIFEDGVTLLGSTDLDDFYADDFLTPEPRYQDVSHSSYTKAMFYASNAENIILKGNATIDMRSVWQKEDLRKCSNRGAKVISVKYVKNLRIFDLRILNATDIAILMGACKDVYIRGVYMRTHIDGISPDGCEDVIISDCNLFCGDDAIVPKASLFDGTVHHMKRMTVTNCIISSRCNGIKLGTESTGDFKYITISNCVVHNVRCTGISVESVDGSNIEGINIDGIMMENVCCPIFVVLGGRMRCPEDTPKGSLRNVTISNVYADNTDKPYESIDHWFAAIGEGSEIQVNDSVTSNVVNATGGVMENVTLRNIHLRVIGGVKKEEASFTLNEKAYPTDAMFGRVLPSYGLYSQGVKNFVVENFTAETVYPDERPDVIILP